MQKEKIIHCKASCATIPIRKRMDIFKLSMKISCRNERIFVRYALQIIQKFGHFFGHIFHWSPHIVWTDNVVVLFVFAGAFALLVSVRIVGVFGQCFLELFDQCFIQRPPLFKC